MPESEAQAELLPESQPDVPTTTRQSGRKRRRWKALSKSAIIALWIVGGVVTIGGIGGMAYYSRRPNMPERVRTVDFVQLVVRQRMGPGVVSTFSPPEWTHIEHLPGNKYYISGWLHAAASNGATASYTYSATVAVRGSTMTIERLDLLQQ
jgi:hypothetical protein